jgi:hypothetical protein
MAIILATKPPADKPKLLDQVRAVIRRKHYSIRTVQELLGHKDLSTTMISPMCLTGPALE